MVKIPELDADQLKLRIEETIMKELRHKWYARTVELATMYRRFMTGDDQKELLVIYKPREDEAQKEQRITLTNSATKHVCGKLKNQFNKVDRVDNVVDNIFYMDEKKANNVAIAEIHARLNVFYKNEPIKKYLDESFKHLNFYDPNSWIITEIHDFNPLQEKPFTYPVEVYSDQAINYKKINGLLQWIVVQHEKIILNKADNVASQQTNPNLPVNTKPEVGFTYRIYGHNVAIVYDELGTLDVLPDGYDLVRLEMKDKKVRTFAVKTFNTKSKEVPAICVGYIPDSKTNRETYVGILDNAEKVLKDIIRSKSEYDLANALHGYLQKYMYGKPCNHRTENNVCHNGTYASGIKCEKCKGTGMDYHTSVQDMILISKPESKEEHIPLSDFVYYVPIPETLIDRHKLDLEKYEKDVAKAVFTVNIFDRSEIAVTATEKKIDLDNVYDVFSAYGAKWSSVYKHIVTITAVHLQSDDGLIVEHKFPSDFKMETVDELIAQRKSAKDAGAPYEVVRYIDLQILAKQNVDNAETVAMVDSMEQWKPFRSKSDQERSYSLSQLPADDDQRILWMYWDRIWREIELDEIGKLVGKEDSPGIPFYKKPKDIQWHIISSKIKGIKDEVTARAQEQQNQIQNQPGPFGGNKPGNPTNAGASGK